MPAEVALDGAGRLWYGRTEWSARRSIACLQKTRLDRSRAGRMMMKKLDLSGLGLTLLVLVGASAVIAALAI